MGFNHSDVWWTNVTGPQMLIKSVVDALSDNRSVLLELPALTPWPNRMRELVADIAQGELDLEGSTFDVLFAEDFDDGQSPVDALLDRYALVDVRHGYRASFDAASYLLEHQVLKDRVIWVTGLGPEQVEAWMRLVRNWSPNSPSDGLFIIETMGQRASLRERGSAEGARYATVAYGEMVGDYSVSLFNGLLVEELSSASLTVPEKRYCASLLSHVCGGDVEVSDAVSGNIERLLENALDCVCSVAGCFESSRGECDRNNVLTIARKGEEGLINHRVWEAQVEVLFPILEARRLAVIARLHDRIDEALKEYEVYQFGERVTEPEDVELGTLVYLMSARGGDGQRLLYVPDEAQRNEIHLLRDCRNNIAHHKPCEWEKVKCLLG